MGDLAHKTLLVCLCAAVLAGCGAGDDGTIPSEESSELITLLDAVEENVAGGNCTLAQGQVGEFVTAVNELPSSVDDEVEQGLAQGATRLTELTNDTSQCEETTGDSGVEGVAPPETTTTEPPETTTTTTEEEPAPEETDEGDDGGGGEEGSGPPEAPPGQGGTPPGQDDGSEGPTSGGIGGEKRGAR